MELRGGDDQEMGTPTTLRFDSSNRESSTRLPNSPLLTSPQRRRDQTLVQLHFAHHHNQNHHNSDPNPDPIPSIPQPIANSRPISRTPIAAENVHSPPPVRYRECLKNHAASTGGHVLDGCGEFMPGGDDCTPEALKCAACECHRNFHRREMRDTGPPLSRRFPAVPISSMMMAFGGSNGAPAESSSEDLNTTTYHQQSNNGALQAAQIMKKRFRTKFTEAQKEKMVEFAEKVGWKIQKHDELQVQQFCAEVGVKRQVFKVWMHNNKQAIKKKNKQM